MRQLESTELATVSGGNDALLLIGLSVTAAFVIGALSSIRPPCNQVITPVFDPISGIYLGDMVDTYCW